MVQKFILSVAVVCLTFGMAVNSPATEKNHAAARTTLADPAEDNYDIKYLNLKLHITDTSTYISRADAATTATVVSASMSSYVFELDTAMHIDSAKVNGALLPVSVSGFVRTITLPSPLTAGTTFTAEIFYRGTPPAGSGFFNAVTHSTSAWGTQMVYTVSDPWVAKDWWPCKQSATDKIDSVDMFVTVPRGVADGSNGLLVNVDTTITSGYSQYHWQTHYPIDYYLVSIAVARYQEYKSYVHFTGSADSMLIQNFFADTAIFNPLYKANFDSLGMMVDYYSQQFGRYPFWHENYCVCYTTLPGGMENQTMTTIGVPDTKTIAHELMHQWFGDNVTYATWGEMWLSEGFATWAEQFYLTHFWDANAGRAHRASLLGIVLGQTCGETYVTDTSGPGTLFFQPTVYYKGQGIITMLRYMAPADSLFFEGLQVYQQRYAYSNAHITDLAAIFDSVYGFSVDSFLSQWTYGKGFPKYTITWDQVGSTVVVKLVQSRSCPSYDHFFITPVELELHSSTGSSQAVQAFNTANTQIFTYTFSDPVDAILLNPDALTICKQNGSIVQDTTLRNSLSLHGTVPGAIQIHPNPTRNNWTVDLLPLNAYLTLTDITGKVLWQGKSSSSHAVVPGGNLPAGNYLLKIKGDNNTDSVKLTHW